MEKKDKNTDDCCDKCRSFAHSYPICECHTPSSSDWESRFDSEIDEGFLRGASTGKQLVGIKRFIQKELDAQSELFAEELRAQQDIWIKEGQAEGIKNEALNNITKVGEVQVAFEEGKKKALEEVKEKIEGLLWKIESNPNGALLEKLDDELKYNWNIALKEALSAIKDLEK